jgi:transcriptional regulator with XRE-family HTH domain
MSATTDIADSPQPELGSQLRALRIARGLSVRDVGMVTSISPSFLSLVERGRSDITIGRLKRLVEFYGVSLLDLVPEEPIEDSRVVRRTEQRLLHSKEEGVDIHLLVPDMRRDMVAMLVEFAPGCEFAEGSAHRGEEWVYVIEGDLRIEFGDGQDAIVLNQGDSSYYDSTTEHRFINANRKRSLRIICVDTPAVF